MRTGLKPEIFASSQIERVMKNCGGCVQKLIRRISTLNADDEPYAPPIGEVLNHLNLALQKLDGIHSDPKSELESIARYFKGMLNRFDELLPLVAEQVELLTEIIKDKHASLDQLDRLLRLTPSFVLQLKPENRKKKDADKPLPALYSWLTNELVPLV